MEPRLKVASLAISFGLLLFILELVRRKRLKEKYSLLWLVMGATVILLVLWPGLTHLLKSSLGILAVSNMILFAAVMFIIVMCVHFSVRISTLSEQTKVLTQELALMRSEVERDRSTRTLTVEE